MFKHREQNRSINNKHVCFAHVFDALHNMFMLLMQMDVQFCKNLHFLVLSFSILPDAVTYLKLKGVPKLCFYCKEVFWGLYQWGWKVIISYRHHCLFLDALASLDFKLSVSQSLSDSPFSSNFTASASTGLSDLFQRIQHLYCKRLPSHLSRAVLL